MGRFWARCNLGSDHKSQVHRSRDRPGVVGAAIYRAILNRSAIETQSPEQGGGCRCLPNLQDRLWFPHAINSCLLLCLRNQFNSSLTFAVFASSGPATQPRALSSLPCPGAAAHTPLHSPRAGAVTLPTCVPLLLPLSSLHSSHPARRAAARIVVNPCPVRMAPKYSARFQPAAGVPSCPRLC